MRGTAVEAGSVQVAGEATTLSKDGDDPGGDDRRAHGDADQQGPARRPADHHRECADGEEQEEHCRAEPGADRERRRKRQCTPGIAPPRHSRRHENHRRPEQSLRGIDRHDRRVVEEQRRSREEQGGYRARACRE